MNAVFSSTNLLPQLASVRGVCLFLRADVDAFNSWCLYLKSATLECAA